MLLALLVFVAGGVSLSHQTQESVQELEEKCYEVVSCIPSDEPEGDHKEQCRIYEDSLLCMQKALDACQQLNFPPETMKEAANNMGELRHHLDQRCSDLQDQEKVRSERVRDEGEGQNHGSLPSSPTLMVLISLYLTSWPLLTSRMS